MHDAGLKQGYSNGVSFPRVGIGSWPESSWHCCMQGFEKEFLVYFNLWVSIAHEKGLKDLRERKGQQHCTFMYSTVCVHTHMTFKSYFI